MISWIKAAQKDFEKFPLAARQKTIRALKIAAEGQKTDIVKPMKGLGSGIYEIVLRYESSAYRVVYAVQIGADLWVIHAFQKKSRRGISTPKQDIDVIQDRIQWLKENIG
ncbi:MAG: type II toxin-antitoxin system RelE/ParE family toxin [Nitrospira sp. SB0677_bin_15]|nr:type II toxin-antitoxin system RelE/ParE family toxin [Nitrospira sp. SB0677_bin_15]